MQETPHRWLLTYDDSPFIRQLYADYTQVRWTLQYGMNNYKQPVARAGEELFITNYAIETRSETPQLCMVFEQGI